MCLDFVSLLEGWPNDVVNSKSNYDTSMTDYSWFAALFISIASSLFLTRRSIQTENYRMRQMRRIFAAGPPPVIFTDQKNKIK